MAFDAEDVQRRSTDPTIPFDGANPEDMPGHRSNVELDIAAEKLVGGVSDDRDESRRGRVAQARQKAKTGAAIMDSDAAANPHLADQVGEDHGEQARKQARQDTAPEGRTSDSPAKATAASKRGSQTA
jgi:hypothetical protein